MVVLTGIFSLMYVPSQLIVWSEPSSTLANIQSNIMLFRLGIVGGLLCYFFFALLVWSLFSLLNGIHDSAMFLMVALALCSIPIAVFAIHYELNILGLMKDQNNSNPNLAADVLNQLRLYARGINVADLFWSSWLFPFGYLVNCSGFFPKALGLILMVGSASYFIYFIGGILLPENEIIRFFRTPASIAEIGTCLWLLIVGAKSSST